jgi:hypothetical protein
MTQPTSVPADGNQLVLWVPTIAAPSAPTVAELTGVSVVNLSCYLAGNGFNNSVDEGSVDDPRLCSRQTFEQPGKFKHGLNLIYVYNPKSPTNDVARLTLVYLTTGYIVTRYGVAFETTPAAADIVDVYPAKCGKQVKMPSEDNSVLKIGQKIFITGEVEENAVVV